jgi:hypothetical protein
MNEAFKRLSHLAHVHVPKRLIRSVTLLNAFFTRKPLHVPHDLLLQPVHPLLKLLTHACIPRGKVFLDDVIILNNVIILNPTTVFYVTNDG